MRYILHTPRSGGLQGMVVIQDDAMVYIWTCSPGQEYRKHDIGTIKDIDQYVRSMTNNHLDPHWKEVKRCAANRWMRERGITP